MDLVHSFLFYHKLLINARYIKDNYFPFTPGVGIKKCLEKIGITLTFISPHWIRLSSPNENEKVNEIKKSKTPFMNLLTSSYFSSAF